MNTVTMTASREVNAVCGLKHCVVAEPHTTEDDEHVAFEVRRGEPGSRWLARVWKYVVPDPEETEPNEWQISVDVREFAYHPAIDQSNEVDQLMMALFVARSTCERANREAVA